MGTVVIVVAVLIVAALGWAFFVDRRRRRDGVIGDAGKSLQRWKATGQQKAHEWGHDRSGGPGDIGW